MRIRSRWLTRLGMRAATIICRVLFWTCRKQVYTYHCSDEINPYTAPGDKRFLFCIWHDDILMTVFGGRTQKVAGLVSRHQDGGYLSDVMNLVGITPVRGSTSRGGAQALKQLLELTADLHISITPDGPRGPRHKIKPGIVFLASHAGRGIVPVAFACHRSWRIKGSWTDMLLPKPFTRIVCAGGPIIHIPPNLSRDQLQEHVAQLEQRMADLQQVANRLLAGEELKAIEAETADSATTNDVGKLAA